MALTAIDDGSQRVTSPAAAKTPAERARRWIDDIRLAQRDREWWYKQNRELIKRYKQADRERPSTYTVDRRRRFSLFWSNIEVLKPATMARQPKAIVRRRFDDQDTVARTATQVLERAINFSVDICDGGGDRLGGIRDEYLLVGLGQAWVRYVPKMHTETPEGMTAQKGEAVSEGGQSYDVVDWEEALYDHVSWDDFLHNVARKWSEVRWVARRAFMTRDELCARFGEEIGKVVPLNHKQPDQPSVPDDRNDPYKKAEVWELWDKPSKTVFWINLDYPLGPLDERDDPLELREFFPCPKPLLGTCGPDSLLPLADYLFYRTQCRDIDELTHRIGRLTDALKMRGFYAAGSQVGKQLQNLFEKDTNELIPVDSWAAYAEAGGVKGLIEWIPLDMVVSTITACIANRKQLIDDVYQITGISDIMRGDVDPNETATATQKKTTWGSSRVRSKQREIARFSCDLLGLLGELICNKFDPKTLAAMTNVKLLPDQKAKQQLMALATAQAAPPPTGPPPSAQGGPPLGPPGGPPGPAAAPGGPPAPPPGPPGAPLRPPGGPMPGGAPAPPGAPPGAPPPPVGAPPPGGPPVGNPAPPPAPAGPPPRPPLPPVLMDMLQRPTWEEVMTMLRDEAQRTFRIDVETNSTIEPDATEEVQDRVQVTQVLGLYISKTIPLLQLYPATAPLVAATAKWLIQSMHAGREIEEDFDKALDQFQMAVAAAGPGGMPGQNQQQAQATQVTQQAQLMSAQAKVSSAQTDQFKAQTERMKVGAETQTDRMQIQAEMQRTQAEHLQQAQQQSAEHASDHAMQLADQQHSQDMDLRDKLHEVLIQQEARRFARDVTAPSTETGLEPNPVFKR